MGIKEAKTELVKLIKNFYGDNLLSIIFYGQHLKDPSFPEIDVVVIIEEPYDPVKMNRVADFVENIRDPIEAKYGYHVSFELYTREEAENFHSGYLDVIVNYDVAYDKEDYFQNLMKDMLDPKKTMEYVKYISTIEYIPVDREEKE
ncbi:nucleotidyltransferase [Thermococcus sp. Bubb.Bath]|uniref:nucleotidyltransferase n=1 Tax=Thermococcus sp. Bubb.Bath TaxID=1638242 RepID=UPI00143CAB46|nr:nucleotidyltransferase [Thermococcus sp. Bubb.Bath]NJF25792.1 nucleotidyltransferase [Thermococcus sp. Bubb.Bath]